MGFKLQSYSDGNGNGNSNSNRGNRFGLAKDDLLHSSIGVVASSVFKGYWKHLAGEWGSDVVCSEAPGLSISDFLFLSTRKPVDCWQRKVAESWKHVCIVRSRACRYIITHCFPTADLYPLKGEKRQSQEILRRLAGTVIEQDAAYWEIRVPGARMCSLGGSISDSEERIPMVLHHRENAGTNARSSKKKKRCNQKGSRLKLRS